MTHYIIGGFAVYFGLLLLGFTLKTLGASSSDFSS
jgi:hypothetical protein